jgi:hypothetical protein
MKLALYDDAAAANQRCAEDGGMSSRDSSAAE